MVAQLDEAPVTLVVNLPADARLTVDGVATVSTSDVRVFTSPALPLGKDYSYTLQAEVIRDGKAHVVARTVDVRPGEETQVTLDFSDAAVASR